MKILLLTTLLLVSCQSKKIDATLYQPNQLFLKAGQEISTKEGKYLPQTDEIWFSAKTVESLERIISRL